MEPKGSDSPVLLSRRLMEKHHFYFGLITLMAIMNSIYRLLQSHVFMACSNCTSGQPLWSLEETLVDN